MNTKIKSYVKSKIRNLFYIDTNKILKYKDYSRDNLHLNRFGKDKICNKIKNIISCSKSCVLCTKSRVSNPVQCTKSRESSQLSIVPAVNSYPSTSYPRDPVVIESSLMTPSQPFDMIRTPIHSSHSVMNRIPNNLETPMFRSSPTILNLSALNHSHGYYRLTQRINLSTFSDTSSVFGSPIPAIQPGTNRVNNNERNFPEQGQIMET